MAANNRRMSGKKGAQVGSGGQRRRGLEGKGPTPPAEMRKGHAKQRAAQAKARRAT
ncbi:23S rRNA (guanosine(2251)-2'-O)-methyltransferase RlmB, partial [Streptomyces sp. S12]|nr:23S rRNA (guanosine(2251)-2'-O)-methyltransferase RlmB [Streptomyces sp. S12]